ncbi:MAG: hypothetical protein PHV07_03650 [Oscillospiraceae bacterium]|nr:hypothetical protein [Oscillospiraceae bacterium]
MNFLKTNRQKLLSLSVPELSGGMNTNSALHKVGDNQLTDCRNMWWNDGALVTRPGFYLSSFLQNTVYNTAREYNKKSAGQITLKDGTKYALSVLYTSGLISVSAVSSTGGTLNFPKVYFSDDPEQPEVDIYGNVYISGIGGEPLVFSGKASTSEEFKIYIIVPRYKYSSTGGIGDYIDTFVFCATDEFTLTNLNNEIYVPTLLINGKGNNFATLTGTSKTEYPDAFQFESQNMLTGKFKSYFKTDGVSSTYSLPTALTNEIITIKYSKANGEIDSWTIAKDADTSDTVGGLNCVVSRTNGTLTFYNASGAATPLEKVLGKPNNLEIIAYHTEATRSERIAKMTKSIWFGGSSGGIGGGTRLFICGNDDEPNLIWWSDLNNPLFFPQNNYAYIGDSAQKVTAFAKQSEMLVVFKPHETYYTTYVEGNGYAVEDVISGKITNVKTVSATFPLYQIHSEIGCDLPNTLQLCSNKLLWTNSDKKVYTLASTYSYSEKNIYTVSEMIERKFKSLDFTAAFALDYDHHYLLFVGTKIFVLDYAAKAFDNITTNSDDVSLQKGITWYEWEQNLGIDIIGGISSTTDLVVFGDYVEEHIEAFNNHMYILSNYFKLQGGKDYNITGFKSVYFDTEKTIITGCEPVVFVDDISSMLQTKLFDFKSFERRKNIKNVYIGVGTSNESTLYISFLTERGTINMASEVQITETASDYSPECLKTVSILPCQPMVLCFGLKIESKGSIAISGININYKVLGCVK